MHDSEQKAEPTTQSFGKLNISFVSREVSLDGDSIPLSSHEFDLLNILAHHAGEVMSRDLLFSLLYRRPYDGLDRIVDVRISQLRKKLGDNPDNPSRIKTVWGKGYLFVPDAW
jgi:DNA-binding response OmpR family regulator